MLQASGAVSSAALPVLPPGCLQWGTTSAPGQCTVDPTLANYVSLRYTYTADQCAWGQCGFAVEVQQGP